MKYSRDFQFRIKYGMHRKKIDFEKNDEKNLKTFIRKKRDN